jgi:hypothetical protein
VVLGQFLSWIAATFRLPQHDKLSRSTVDFKHDLAANENTLTKTFQIHMRNLAPVDNAGAGSCWHPLFPSTVMASGFRIHSQLDAFGLRVPFDLMLKLAGILYHVDLREAGDNEDGIFFVGICSILYPTHYVVDTNTIQWHLVTNPESKTLGRHCSPDDISGGNWARIRDFEILSSATAILGYCREAAIQLGTESRREQYARLKFSRSSTENPFPEISIGTVTASASAMGFGTVQAGGALKYRKGLADAVSTVEDITYREILNYSEKDPVILFETATENERAWLVPRLSVILELVNYWAEKNKDPNAVVRYAPALPDGGRAAKEVLQLPEYANMVLVAPTLDDTRIRVRDIVKRVFVQMQRRESACVKSDRGARGTLELGRQSLLGWDLREVVEPRIIARRRTINPHITAINPHITVTPCWLPLTELVPVYFGQCLGELITPIRPSDVCRIWQPIPGGFVNNFLAASVRCIVAISTYNGYDDCCILFDDLLWVYTDESLFSRCQRCVDDGQRQSCCKKIQVLQHKKHNKVRFRNRQYDGSYRPRIDLDGVVVFGNKEGIRRSLVQLQLEARPA